MKKIILTIILCILLISIPVNAEITHYTYEIINTYPHDIEAFTQGFTFNNGYIYESTGLRGESSLRKVELETGEIKKMHELQDKYFGEGITIYNDKIYQLTWEAETGFIYNRDFELIDKFNYETEGWGLTNDGNHLIMSDGSSSLYFLDPETMEKVSEITVTYNNQPIQYINELEYIHGKIFANVWYQDYIIIINPESGKISGVIHLENIIDPKKYDHELDVLNGIAHDGKNDRLFVTGKLWPLVFEINLIEL